MSEDDRRRWDERHAARRGEPLEAEPFLGEALAVLGARPARASGVRPRALDVACGRGRHALELARRGWDVDAVDVSQVALDELSDAARAQGLAVRVARRDLEAEGLPAGRWDLVLVVHYLQRDLFPGLVAAVAPGGALAVETFTTRHAELTGFRRDLCLEPGELARLVAGPLDVVLAREGPDARGRHVASLVAVRP